MDSAYAEYLGRQLLIMLIVIFIVGGLIGVGLWEGIPWVWHHISFNLH